MKVLIIDPALHSMGGHHHSAVRRLHAEFAGLGIAAPCLGSAYVDDTVRRELACTPVFTRSVYGRAYAGTAEFDESVAETAAQLSQAMRPHGAPDLVVLPCCDAVLAAALARIFRQSRRPPRLLLWILYGPHHLKAADDGTAAALQDECRDAYAALVASVGGRHRIEAYCETAPLADFYRRLTALDVGVLPGPGLAGQARPRSHDGRQPPTVACIGFANRSKGYRLVPEAIERVLRSHRDAQFLIHGVVRGSDAEADQPAFDRMAGLGERVVVRQDVLTPDEYGTVLAATDLLLLPYDPETYRIRGSGVFADASRIGIPVVATAGCTFARPAFEGGWGVAMVDYSGVGLARAILTALDSLAELAARAAAVASEAEDGLPGVLQAALGASGATRRGRFAEILGRLGRFA